MKSTLHHWFMHLRRRRDIEEDVAMAVLLKRCAETGCHDLVPRGTARCAAHARKPFAGAQRSTTLYATRRWRNERAAFLKRHPRCACGEQAKVVDHVRPHRGNEALFWDQTNWQPLCWFHSNSKTGSEVRRGRGG